MEVKDTQFLGVNLSSDRDGGSWWLVQQVEYFYRMPALAFHVRVRLISKPW